MDISEAKERLLKAVRGGETIVMFGEAVKASVSPEGKVYKVEVTGHHPKGFPHWNEETSVAAWEGPEVDEAAKRVVDALAGVPAKMVQEVPVAILAENVSLADLVWVTKPYDKLSDAPENIRELDGAKLTLSQVNWIANMADGLKGKKDIESPWAVAKAQFKKVFKKEGGKWVKPKEEEKKKEVAGKETSLNQVQDAFYAAFNPPGADVTTGPRVWTKDIFPTAVVVEDGGQLYRASYTTEGDVIKFADRTDWEKGKMVWEAEKVKEQSLDAMSNKEIDLQGKINSIESAFRKQMRPLPIEETAVEIIRPRIVKLFDTYMITRIGQKHYRVSYTVDKDKGPQFAPRAEWAEVEQTWTPKGKEGGIAFWHNKEEPTARMFLAAAKAYLQRKESETTVWQEGDRRFYLGLVSLPSIKDKEGEVVTAEGADCSMAVSRKYGYHSGLYIKHVVPKSLIGRSLHERRIGPFWVEMGEFKDTPLADWAFRILERDKEGKWRFSIGFITPKKQAFAGRYTRLLKFDSTITEVPAQPLTAMLALMKKEEGGTIMVDQSQSVQKLMTFLNPETSEEKAQVTKMLADLFEVEEKELVAITKGLDEARAAIEALGDEKLKETLLTALAAEPSKAKKKEDEPGPVEDRVAEVIKEAIAPLAASVKDVVTRLEAVEASAGSAALQELRAALLTRSRDYTKPSEDALPVTEGAEILEKLEKMLNPESVGKHPLAGFAHGPASAEGG